VTGYSYAVTPCTGTCDGSKQDLAGFAAALEKSPLSICVNAGSWNDYTGGVMSAQACGPSGAEYQDHCVMATGFNATGNAIERKKSHEIERYLLTMSNDVAMSNALSRSLTLYTDLYRFVALPNAI